MDICEVFSIKKDTIVDSLRASMDQEEVRDLLELLADFKPKVVLEIGVHRGYSMELWRKAFNPPVIIGIDNDLHAVDKKATEGMIIIDGDSHTSKVRDYVEVVLTGLPVDLLFIDGDHHYDSVKKDWELYTPLVKKGGVVILHDVSVEDNSSVDVSKFWQNLDHSKFDRSVLIHNKNGTGIGVIFL